MNEQTYPSGRVVKNVLDANGDLEIVQSKKNSAAGYWNYAENFTYNGAGAVTSMQLGNGKWESTQFNSRLQPTQIALGSTNEATNLLKLDYSYGTTANNGNVLSQKITVNRPSQSDLVFDQLYTYDSLNRITSAEEKTGTTVNWNQTYTFDRYGNRNFNESLTTTLPKGCVDGGNPVVCLADRKVFNPELDPANNRMATGQGWAYDAAGNVTTDAEGRTFTYDGENKQIEVKNYSNATVGQYFFDGDGKRIKKVVPSTGETTIFIYDAGAKLIDEYSTIIQPVQDAKVQYLTNDHLGSPRINTDRDGNVTSRRDFHPFGEEIARSAYGSDIVRQKFTGYERDSEINLDYAGTRYYNSQHGRFTSPDDFLNDTHVSDPKSWNLYVYVRNNPLNYIDPFGEEVYSTNLSDEEKKKLIEDWQKKTGYKNVYFDKDNKLVIDTKAGFEGGSKSARQLLSDAVNSTEKRFNLTSVDDKKVAFAEVDAGTINYDGSGKKVGPTVFKVSIDFKDFNQFRASDKDAVAAFSIGIAVFHEVAHKLYTEIGDKPNSDTDPGPVENTYINPIRRELGLAERIYYSGKSTPAALKSFFPSGGNQLLFRLNKKDKILRWQTDQVGGKVQ
ncbi:MAG: RHS repeat-associated core domain-containing protein [Acidobacteriota bacterium]|nr:MAG: RHS repeat-associated core domain-containing protein [Acidobacteriota bacterium]